MLNCYTVKDMRLDGGVTTHSKHSSHLGKCVCVCVIQNGSGYGSKLKIPEPAVNWILVVQPDAVFYTDWATQILPLSAICTYVISLYDLFLHSM